MRKNCASAFATKNAWTHSLPIAFRVLRPKGPDALQKKHMGLRFSFLLWGQPRFAISFPAASRFQVAFGFRFAISLSLVLSDPQSRDFALIHPMRFKFAISHPSASCAFGSGKSCASESRFWLPCSFQVTEQKGEQQPFLMQFAGTGERSGLLGSLQLTVIVLQVQTFIFQRKVFEFSVRKFFGSDEERPQPSQSQPSWRVGGKFFCLQRSVLGDEHPAGWRPCCS